VRREIGLGTVDVVNRATWSRPDVVRDFGTIDGWAGDVGETVIFERVADLARGHPILDLGVGAGRTVPAMLALSDDYVGLDYTLEMVAAARRRFPGVRIEHGDARDLRTFEDGSFAFVFFSFNGIDAVPHADRALILQEVRRVLRPGGAFGFSTHNLSLPRAGAPPWALRHWPRTLRGFAGAVARLPVSARAYRRNARLVEHGDGWAMLVSRAHSFGIVVHYTTASAVIEELRAAGFAEGVELYASNGTRLDPLGDTSGTPWLHLLAYVPTTG
jgi:SAM-dependent methyltransferase